MKWLALVCCLWFGWNTASVFANSDVTVIVQLLEEKGQNIQSVGNEISVNNSLKQQGILTEKSQVTQAKVMYNSSQQVEKLSAERKFIERDSNDTGMKLAYFNEDKEVYYWKDTETWHVSLLEEPITNLYPDYFVHLKLVTDILKKAEKDGLDIKIEETANTYHLMIEDGRLDLINAMKGAYEMSITGITPLELRQRLQIVVNRTEGRIEKITFEIEGDNQQANVKIKATNTYSDWNSVKEAAIIHPGSE